MNLILSILTYVGTSVVAIKIGTVINTSLTCLSDIYVPHPPRAPQKESKYCDTIVVVVVGVVVVVVVRNIQYT